MSGFSTVHGVALYRRRHTRSCVPEAHPFRNVLYVQGARDLLVFVAVLFGLVVGSFLNVVIHRVPRRESIVWPASHCPHCGEPIRARDNVPLISYLLLRGRCRNCKERISARYPAVEALTGLLFGAAAYEFGVSLELLPALVLIPALIALAAHRPRAPAAA